MRRDPIFLALAALACAVLAPAPSASAPATDQKTATSSAQAADQGTSTSRVERFGAAITESKHQGLAEVLAEPAAYEGKTVLVEGHVRRACTRKGCWMELASSADPEATGCRVTFKDYGFFVPTDSAGSRALVEARVQVETLDANHVAHLEEEGAKFPDKQADGTAREVHLVATGVELTRQ
jgi:Domain of unknown function (DUF4920)